jgi:hypothetical protein
MVFLVTYLLELCNYFVSNAQRQFGQNKLKLNGIYTTSGYSENLVITTIFRWSHKPCYNRILLYYEWSRFL